MNDIIKEKMIAYGKAIIEVKLLGGKKHRYGMLTKSEDQIKWKKNNSNCYITDDNYKGIVSFDEKTNEVTVMLCSSVFIIITEKNMYSFEVQKLCAAYVLGLDREELIDKFEKSIISKIKNDVYYDLRNEILKRLEFWETDKINIFR